MVKKMRVLGINGSASRNSSNFEILKWIGSLSESDLDFEILDDLAELPHFQVELADSDVPKQVMEFRSRIENSDGIIICTPEYVFSIPSRLKNAIEWCVSTTVFSDKPVGIITASASGERGHEELKLIMKTIQARLADETMLLIQGVKGKVNDAGLITDRETADKVRDFIKAFTKAIRTGR